MTAVHVPKCGGGVWLFHKTEPTTQRAFLEIGLNWGIAPTSSIKTIQS